MDDHAPEGDAYEPPVEEAGDGEDRILGGLTAEQRRAVEHGDGPLIVVAGPGSGKTRVIARRVAYLVERLGVPGWSVLAITFTNKAAEEMRHRVDDLLGRGVGVTVSTFHSFCARTLRKYGAIDRSTDFSIYDEDDQRACVRKALEALKLEEKQWKPGAMLARISDAKNKRITAEAFESRATAFQDRMVAKVYRKYEELLKEYNALDFDDLLLAMLDVLEQREEVREDLRVRFKYVLVDEYQDTNRVQYEIANQLAGPGGNLCVVGDADQSIYKWRGADLRNLLDFEQDHPGAVEVRLEQNFRSTKRILAAAQGLIRHNVERREKDLYTDNDAGDAIKHVRCLSDAEEARLVATSIEQRVREGVPTREIAVFYRTNGLSRKFEEELANRGIKHVVIGAVPFFARKEVKDVLSFVRLRANVHDDAALRRAIALAEGFGAKTLDKLAAYATAAGIPVLEAIARAADVPELQARQRKSAQGFFELVTSIFTMPEAPVGPILRAVVERTGVKDRLMKSEDPQDWARADNIEQLVNGAYEFDERNEGKTFREYLDQVALLVGAPEEKDKDGVRLMTLHAAKGLEFDEVYIAGVDGGLLPLEREMEPCDTEEERRLFYVGITRARKRVTMTSVQVRRTWGLEKLYRPSDFLKELPEEAIERASSAFFGDRDAPRPVDLRGGASSSGARRRLAADHEFGDSYEGDDEDARADEMADSFLRRARAAGPSSHSRRAAPANPDAEDEDVGDAPHADDDEIAAEPWSSFRPKEEPPKGGPPARKPAPWERDRRPALWERPRASLAEGERMRASSAGAAPAPRAAAPPETPIVSSDSIREGERVAHPVFGRGSVVSTSGAGVHRRITVRFDQAGVKMLLIQYAKLTRAV